MPNVTQCAYDREVATADTDEVGLGIYTLRWKVETDGVMAPAAVANEALLASPHPLPSRWSTYSYQGHTDSLSFARDYHVERDPKSVKLYYITVTYRPPEMGDAPTDSGAPINSEPNPLQRAPIYWWDREVFTERIEKDIEGTVIQNYAKGLYPSDIEQERARGVLVIEFNVATLAEVIYYSRTYDQAVNESPWGIGGATIPARAALCREVSSGPPISETGYRFYRIIMRIPIAGDGANWDVPKAELGRFHWEKDDNGEYITTRGGFRNRVDAGGYVALKEDGTRQADTEETLVKAWRCRPEADFNNIPA